jgi:murein DD-endopeptidase MepM/ murein hydrolase activator NlpD
MRKIYAFLIAIAVLLLLVPSLYLIFLRKQEPVVIPRPPRHHHFAYKINIDTLDITFGKVGASQNLSALLSPYISGQLVDRISKESGQVFDVRKIHAGNTIARIHSRGPSTRMLYFIYQVNDVDYIVWDFRDSLRIYADKKQVETMTKTASGTITSSLWNAIDENNLDINLGMKLADVYAWTVDFYGLQKGDGFKVYYEELYVDSSYIGTGRILAAKFNSSGRTFYAFHFQKDSILGYFDDNGASLRRAFLKAPLHFSRISSRYSKARMHPILRIVRPHYGVDYSAPSGTPVVALGDGRINEAGWKGGYGRFISIRHNAIYSTTYAHLSGYAKGIKAGTSVHQGDLIGYVGMSGLATGPHLDFRVYRNGAPVDPLKIESPSTKPVDKIYLADYMKLVADMKKKLTMDY